MPVTAILRVAHSFPGEGHTADHTKGEYTDIIGTGDTWAAAKADAEKQVPEGALKLHWRRG